MAGFPKAPGSRRRSGSAAGQKNFMDYYLESTKMRQDNEYHQALARNDARDVARKERDTESNIAYRKSQAENMNRLREMQKEKQNIEIAEKKLKALSAQYSTVYDPTGINFKNFMNTPQGKNTIRDIGKYLPEQVKEVKNADGSTSNELILMTNHELIKGQLKDKADALQARIPALQTILQQPDLPPAVREHYQEELKRDLAEARAFSIYKDPDLFSKAIDQAHHSKIGNGDAEKDWGHMSPAEQAEAIRINYQMLAKAKMDSIGGVSEPEVTGHPELEQPVQQHAPVVQAGGDSSNELQAALGGIGGMVGNAVSSALRPQSAPIQRVSAPPAIQVAQQGERPNAAVQIPEYKRIS